MEARRRHVIRTSKQLGVLSSPLRQEIVDVLAEMGTVSVADLATTLGRPADALYFHLRRLVAAGLVQRAGDRPAGNRTEALYRTVAPELVLQYQPQRAANRTAVSAIVRSMLRLGIRDVDRALRAGDVIVSGEHRELWALRKTGRVLPARLGNVNRAIKQLVRAVVTPNSTGRLYAITVVLTPLQRPRGANQRARAKRKRRRPEAGPRR